MATFVKAEFARRLKEQRIRAGYSRQKDFAVAADVSVQALSYYENGDRLPDASILFKLAQAAKCTVDYLLQLEGASTHEATDICSVTGLSEGAVNVLLELNSKSKWQNVNDFGDRIRYGAKRTLDTINFMVERENRFCKLPTGVKSQFFYLLSSFLDFEGRANTLYYFLQDGSIVKADACADTFPKFTPPSWVKRDHITGKARGDRLLEAFYRNTIIDELSRLKYLRSEALREDKEKDNGDD